MEIVFKEIKGYEGRYMISNIGVVMSCLRKDSYGRVFGGKILKTRKDSSGYPCISLRDKNNRIRNWNIHRLVAEAFLPKVEGKNVVDHIDGSRDNNNVENLRWCTHKENLNFPIAREKYLSNTNRIMTTERCPYSQVIEKYTLDGEFICSYNSMRKACVDNKTTIKTLREACNGERENAAGYKWKLVGSPQKTHKGRESKRKIKLVCFDKNDVFVKEYSSLGEAAVDIGVTISAISLVVSNKTKRTKNGYKIMRKDEYIQKKKNNVRRD